MFFATGVSSAYVGIKIGVGNAYGRFVGSSIGAAVDCAFGAAETMDYRGAAIRKMAYTIAMQATMKYLDRID